MHIFNYIIEYLYFGKNRREGEARVLDTLVASGIIVLITAVYDRIEMSNSEFNLLISSVFIAWLVRIWLRREQI